jgi:hypothetical protein
MVAMVELASMHVLLAAGTPVSVPGHGMLHVCCPMHGSAEAVRFQLHRGSTAISVALHVPGMSPKNAKLT